MPPPDQFTTQLATAIDRQDAAIILDAGMRQAEPRQLEGFQPYALVPKDCKLEQLEEVEPAVPKRINAAPVLHDAASLIAYVLLFKDEDTRLFADIDKGEVLAVLDYHVTKDRSARWGQHTARYAARPSDEWKVWVGGNSKKMSQAEFALFLEDNARDVQQPTSAEMLTVASTLEAKKAVTFASAVRLQDGQTQFNYTEDIQGTAARGTMPIPATFTVILAPFVGCARYPVEARLRYRIDGGGKLTMWYDLLRTEAIRKDAFDAIMKKIADETKISPLLGVRC
jgi:uncharacterized protein YfdQ (DUF2303 family)